MLREVELAEKVAEGLHVLADDGAGIGAAVGLRVDALPAEEVVLDELEVRVERERLVVDVVVPRPRADQQAGHAEPIALAVDRRRRDVVVEAAPVVPRDPDRGRGPVRALHQRVDEARHVRLPGCDQCRRVGAPLLRRRDPAVSSAGGWSLPSGAGVMGGAAGKGPGGASAKNFETGAMSFSWWS